MYVAYRRRRVGGFTSSSGHQISRADLLNNNRHHRDTPVARGKANGSAEPSTLCRGIACSGVEWRATVDEDGQYCFAVAL